MVEFGEPIYITREISDKYGESKRLAYHALLQQVENGMRSVIVTAHDYNDLKLVHTVRRLYQRSATSMTTKQKQDLARRWSEAYKMLKERYKETGFPQDIQDVLVKVEKYQEVLDTWGLRDSQLQTSALHVSFPKLLYIFLHGLTIFLLASIPSLILNFPVGVAANYWAYSEAKKDLKASRVKLAARDVLLSKKILFSLTAVPILWVTYAVLALLFSSLEKRTVLVLFISCPLFSYMGIMAVEQSIIDLKDLRPAFLRLLPSFRQSAEALPQQRAELVEEIRKVTKKYGPSFGQLYFDKTDAWEIEHFKLEHQKPADADADDGDGVSNAGSDQPNENSPAHSGTSTSGHISPKDRDNGRTNVPTNQDLIASAIATTFSDHDDADAATENSSEKQLENKKNE